MATILIVEDNRQIRHLLEVTLSQVYQVVQASHATQAIEVARRVQPDLVLLDLNLQGHQDGLDVCRTLRSDPNPLLAQVPIVMLTGQSTKADIAAAYKAGANSYMSKPYRPTSLLRVISALLGKKGV